MYRSFFPVLAVLMITVAGCAQKRADDAQEPSSSDAMPENEMVSTNAPDSAMAVLNPTEGNSVRGSVRFIKVDDGVRVIADVTGLASGKHGFHVHENGNCSAPDGSSAGGHFSNGTTPHGAPDNDADMRHAGDLGNVTADSEGHAHLDRVDPVLSLSGPMSIVGRAVIVHGGMDDLTSQPSGAAGPRVACGVIE